MRKACSKYTARPCSVSHALNCRIFAVCSSTRTCEPPCSAVCSCSPDHAVARISCCCSVLCVDHICPNANLGLFVPCWWKSGGPDFHTIQPVLIDVSMGFQVEFLRIHVQHPSVHSAADIKNYTYSHQMCSVGMILKFFVRLVLLPRPRASLG